MFADHRDSVALHRQPCFTVARPEKLSIEFGKENRVRVPFGAVRHFVLAKASGSDHHALADSTLLSASELLGGFNLNHGISFLCFSRTEIKNG